MRWLIARIGGWLRRPPRPEGSGERELATVTHLADRMEVLDALEDLEAMGPDVQPLGDPDPALDVPEGESGTALPDGDDGLGGWREL